MEMAAATSSSNIPGIQSEDDDGGQIGRTQTVVADEGSGHTGATHTAEKLKVSRKATIFLLI